MLHPHKRWARFSNPLIGSPSTITPAVSMRKWNQSPSLVHSSLLSVLLVWTFYFWMSEVMNLVLFISSFASIIHALSMSVTISHGLGLNDQTYE